MLSEKMIATYYPNVSGIGYTQGKTVFNYHETLTVPVYLFDDYHDISHNFIYFAVLQINRNTITGEYICGNFR